MTLTNLYGRQDLLLPQYGGGLPVYGSILIDASTERAALCGLVWIPSRASSFDIRKVHFRCGSVTFGGSSVLRVSLQNVSQTAGPPYQPDGTQDQTADMTSLTANGWNTTGNLSADRTVTPGEAVAVVWEYQTFTASDAVNISNISLTSETRGLGGGVPIFYNGSSWSVTGNFEGIVVFEDASGNYAFLETTHPWNAISFENVSTSATARAAGVAFTVPVTCKVDGFSLYMAVANGSDGYLRLLDGDGSTVLASVTVDNDAVLSTTGRLFDAVFAPVTLSPGTTYRAIFEPSTTTVTAVYYGDVNAAGMLGNTAGGPEAHWTQRNSGGTWAQTTTRKPFWFLRYSAFDDATSGGGLAMSVVGRAIA